MHVFLDQMPQFSLGEAPLDWVPSSNFRSLVALPLVRRTGLAVAGKA